MNPKTKRFLKIFVVTSVFVVTFVGLPVWYAYAVCSQPVVFNGTGHFFQEMKGTLAMLFRPGVASACGGHSSVYVVKSGTLITKKIIDGNGGPVWEDDNDVTLGSNDTLRLQNESSSTAEPYYVKPPGGNNIFKDTSYKIDSGKNVDLSCIAKGTVTFQLPTDDHGFLVTCS